jgi:hypothetical protein
MEKYAKIKDEKTKEVQIGVGCSDEYYVEIGMSLMEVEQAYNNNWYVQGFAPVEPEPTPPTHDEIRQMRAWAYAQEVDCITAHIQRLRDESPVPEGEINELIAERDAKVEEIKARYPYAEDSID